MVRALFVFFSLHLGAAHAQQCDTKATAGGENMIERINQRYDDFFRYRRMEEERDREREKGRGQNHKALEARDKALEKAREAYLKQRKPPVDYDKKIEAEMMKATKERQARLEAARRCYVQQEAKAEATLKRGRQIPGNKEYDIED